MLKVIISLDSNLVNLCCLDKRIFSEGQRQAIYKEVLNLLEKEGIVEAQHSPGKFISNLFMVLRKQVIWDRLSISSHS